MKKINTFLLLFLVSTLTMFAQKDEKTKQALNNASYIFKGTVVSETPFKGEHDKDFLISYEINVETIYKGNQLNLGNITLVTKSVLGWSESEGYIIPDVVSEYTTEEKNMFNLSVGVSGVFACNQYSNKSISIPTTKTELKNNMIIKPICATKYCFFRYVSSAKHENREFYPRKYIKGFGKYFEQTGRIDKKTGVTIWDEETTVWEKLNSYLKEIEITPQKEIVKKKDVEFLKRKKENEILYAERVKNAEKRKQQLEERYQRTLANKGHINNKTNHDIEFEILNEQVTGVSPQFFEFDIMVSGSGSNTTYLDNSAFVIEYNTIPFGQNIVLNNTVTVTRGTSYNTTTYEDPMLGITDDAINAISFIVGVDYNAGSWNRPLLPSIQEQLAHVKIEIQNCSGNTDLQFIDIVNVSFVALYTVTPTIDPFLAPFTSYDVVDYIQPFNNFALCPPPLILNMFPNPISSGTGSVLTIQGSGFGNTQGSGQV